MVLVLAPGLSSVDIIQATGKNLPLNHRKQLEYLFDRNPSTYYHSTSVPTQTPWVQLELIEAAFVSQVDVTNRLDICCQKTLDPGIHIKVGMDKIMDETSSVAPTNIFCGRYLGDIKAGDIIKTKCDKDILGRFVTIQRMGSGTDPINIAEVEVFGMIPGK